MTDQPTSPDTKALDELEKAFTAWRQNKKSPRETIPHDLLAQAAALAPKLGQTKVRARLGLSQAQLKRFSDNHSATTQGEPTTVPEQEFVAVTLGDTIQPDPGLSLTIQLPNGAQLALSGFAQNQRPLDVINKLLGELLAC